MDDQLAAVIKSGIVTIAALLPIVNPIGSAPIAITLGARVPARGASTAVDVVTDMVAVGLVALTVYLSYRFVSRLITYLGETGTIVFLRLSSFILMCVGVSIIWSGIVDLVVPLLTMRR